MKFSFVKEIHVAGKKVATEGQENGHLSAANFEQQSLDSWSSKMLKVL